FLGRCELDPRLRRRNPPSPWGMEPPKRPEPLNASSGIWRAGATGEVRFPGRAGGPLSGLRGRAVLERVEGGFELAAGVRQAIECGLFPIDRLEDRRASFASFLGPGGRLAGALHHR